MDKYDWEDFASFKTMWTPVIIKWVWLITSGFTIGAGILLLIGSLVQSEPVLFFAGLIGTPLILLVQRLLCESTMLFWSMHEKLD